MGPLDSLSLSERVRCRGQFILGPARFDAPGAWQRRTLGSLHLAAHPDLNVAEAVSGSRSIGLIGYLLDPSDPEASDSELLSQLLPLVSDRDRLLERLDELGGRWVLIAGDGRHVRLFHDALGLRQVFYSTTHESGSVWCASQPGLIAHVLNATPDDDVLDLVRSRPWPDNQHWLPGDMSPFGQVRHLLPNHALNLQTGESERYWPQGHFERLTIEDGMDRCEATLSGLLRSANHRFALALSLTAGWDSRLVLAATRSIIDNIICMTLRTPQTPAPDFEIPALLAGHLGFRYETVEASAEPDETFQRIFLQNVPLPHPLWAADAWAILRRYQHSRVAVTGSGGEVARSYYGVSRRPKGLTADQLSAHAGMSGSTLARQAFARWLSTLPDTSCDPLDLFYWEHRTGSWLASAQLEIGDVAWQDVFTPYNCRSLLQTMLSVDVKHRRPPRYELHERLITRLWPAVLTVPINPHYPAPPRIRRIASLPWRATRRLWREVSAQRHRQSPRQG